jgi:hypothetical protein
MLCFGFLLFLANLVEAVSTRNSPDLRSCFISLLVRVKSYGLLDFTLRTQAKKM